MSWKEELSDFTLGSAISIAGLACMVIGTLIMLPGFSEAVEAEDFDRAGLALGILGGLFITPGIIISMIGDKIHSERKKVMYKSRGILDHIQPIFGVVFIGLGLWLVNAVPKALDKGVPEMATAAMIGFTTIFFIPGLIKIAQYFLVTRDEIKEAKASQS